MPEIKLKPCPFCGGKGKLRRESLHFTRWVQYSFIRCEKCFANGKRIIVSVEYSADDKAAEAWNNRAEEIPLPVEYEGDGYDDNCRKCGQKLDWRAENETD